jgi:nicotinamidase/pyrazinamidase
LAISDADEIIPRINAVAARFNHVAASRDMHPADTRHFEKWPVHCVRGTRGAEFHPGLDISAVDCFLEKGASPDDDGYSDFASANIDFARYLRKQSVSRLFVCGLATDYCVLETVLDALRQGFSTIVLEDCIKAVDLRPGDGQRALYEMRQRGAQVIGSNDLDPFFARQSQPWRFPGR